MDRNFEIYQQENNASISDVISADYYLEKGKILEDDVCDEHKERISYFFKANRFRENQSYSRLLSISDTSSFSPYTTSFEVVKLPLQNISWGIELFKEENEGKSYPFIEKGAIGHLHEYEELTKNKELSETLKTLREVFIECSVENWDGYDSMPLPRKAFTEVTKFLKLLPITYQMPDIVPEPNGNIALEWYKNRDFVFVAGISGNNIIEYAGLFNKINKTYGSEHFEDFIPPAILQNIKRVCRGDSQS